MAAIDRLEAAVRADRPAQARAWAGESAAFADATGPPGHPRRRPGRALLSDGADAQALYEFALERHTLSATGRTRPHAAGFVSSSAGRGAASMPPRTFASSADLRRPRRSPVGGARAAGAASLRRDRPEA